MGPHLLTWINFNPSKDHIPSKVWDEITYPFPNFNGRTVEGWEWISNFTAHYTLDVIDYVSIVNPTAMEPESKQKLLQSSPTLIITQSEMEILIDYEGYNYSATLLPGLETDHRLLNGRQVKVR